MTTADYKKIEAYMNACMLESAHDREHVYRVLYTALFIAESEQAVDFDVLLAACLLHDIGRLAQNQNPALDHAEIGAQKAQAFLAENGFSETFCARVADCIYTHRFRSSRPPETVEAKILFDADKLDATGAMGIARTLSYRTAVDEPLYTLCADGTVCDGTGDAPPSFFSGIQIQARTAVRSLLYQARQSSRARTPCSGGLVLQKPAFRSPRSAGRRRTAGAVAFEQLIFSRGRTLPFFAHIRARVREYCLRVIPCKTTEKRTENVLRSRSPCSPSAARRRIPLISSTNTGRMRSSRPSIRSICSQRSGRAFRKAALCR